MFLDAVYELYKGFQSHWKSEVDLTNVTGTSYHWCHLITDVSDAIMHQLPNESMKLLNILYHSYHMLNRKIETFWNSLYDDKSKDVGKFAGAINIK